MRIRFAASARRHGIKKDQIRYAIDNATTTREATLPSGDPAYFMVGPDEDGTELEVIAVVEPTGLYVIHAMINRGKE
ncbi:DUF4258 domain-containing protein [Nakamurella silvestris]|nr:DUF4258 domain-containing protein [Nakamurella silvestris]